LPELAIEKTPIWKLGDAKGSTELAILGKAVRGERDKAGSSSMG